MAIGLRWVTESNIPSTLKELNPVGHSDIKHRIVAVGARVGLLQLLQSCGPFPNANPA